MMGWDMGLGMGLMWLWVLVPLALVVGVGWLIARGSGARQGQPREDDADAILRRRFAAGEIDIEQYEQARAALGLPGAKLGGQRPEVGVGSQRE